MKGITINAFDLNGTSYPLIWGGDAANYTIGSSPDIARYCITGAMNADIVAGKIVFCEALWDGSGILLANGVGTIMADVLVVNPDVAFSWPLPATLISPEDGKSVLEYIRSTEWDLPHPSFSPHLFIFAISLFNNHEEVYNLHATFSFQKSYSNHFLQWRMEGRHGSNCRFIFFQRTKPHLPRHSQGDQQNISSSRNLFIALDIRV